MEPINHFSGLAVPFENRDINTDIIYPQRYLRRPDRRTMGEFLFRDLRFAPDGTEIPDFVLNQEPYTDATILIAGRNFGSGSSREHAPWALHAFGFRVLISSMFADIFRANCVNNGIIPAVVPEADLDELLKAAGNPQDAKFEINLEQREIVHPRLGKMHFQISDAERDRLLHGYDFIDTTLAESSSIEGYEQQRYREYAFLGGSKGATD